MAAKSMGFTRGFISPVCPWSDIGGGPTSNWDLQGPPWAPDVSTLTVPLGQWWLELGTETVFSLSPLEIAWLYFHAWSGGQAHVDGWMYPTFQEYPGEPQSPPVSNAWLNGYFPTISYIKIWEPSSN